MHALRRTWKLLAGLGLAAFLVGLVPGSASALPMPGNRTAYRFFAKAISFINVNRVFLGLNAIGQVGVDSSGRGQTQGGYWPRGTADNYVFNSGLQVAGVIQGAKSPSNPWGGDTTGGWFFDGAGGRQQTEAVTPVAQAFNPADVANWSAADSVPKGDDVANIYAQPLQGLVSASQGDAHFIAWEGNPAFNVARTHPLGILVDYRLLAWNYPAGAQDIVFLVATIYNVTSVNAADYAQHRPGIQGILMAQAQKFQALNDAKFGVTLPQGGYTIGPMYIAAAADNDVGTVNSNYNGAILPFAMEYTYDGPFGTNAAGWKFDPSIFAPPFFVGIGFVGYKYLKGPDGVGAINLATTFCNGNCGGTSGHADPNSTVINYRLLAGTPAATDGQCNITAPGKTQAQLHFCFMLLGSVGADTRMAESSAPLTLAPGEAKSIVVAYIFAPPVAIPGFTPNGINVDPGNVLWSNSGDSMTVNHGLNRIDSLSGFVKYNGPAFNADGSDHVPLQSEFSVVKGSLLGKALVAQALFDVQFLQEFAPDPPQFFLIPGDKQVTILWKPSATETAGDPFYTIVSSPTKLDAAGHTVANPLYDPNYRKFDVEGYRIYRGRSDNPSALQLLVQFDYAGTKFSDFTGAVSNGNCAPEIGVLTDCPVNFPTNTNPVPPGTAYTLHADYNIGPNNGAPLIFVDQTQSGSRLALAGGTTSVTIVADTAVSGAGDGGFPPLADTGVPFIFIDVAGAPGCANCGVNNGVNYFYSVTAFDVNAPGHGPTSLESAKLTHQVTPGALASNFSTSGNLAVEGPDGRSGPLTDNVVPTIDGTTGKFSKKFPPTNGISAALAGFASQILSGGTVVLSVDSIVLNTASSVANGQETVFATDWFSVKGPAGTTVFSLPANIPDNDVNDNVSFKSVPGVLVDSALSAKFGGGTGYSIPLTVTAHSLGAYHSGVMGRGCINSATGFGSTRACVYNGPRWFIGDSETVSGPNSDNPDLFDGVGTEITFNNSGGLAGVAKLWRPVEYFNMQSAWRDFSASLSPFISAADYRLYWGSGGKVDSVIDLTHNTVVPFDPRATASWGILNSTAVTPAGSFDGRAELSFTDISCVSNLRAQAALTQQLPCTAPAASFVQTAVPGPMVLCSGTFTCVRTAATEANNGFLLYLKGRVFMVELTGGTLPTAGTQWTMRDYVGAIRGGNGNAGNFGTYRFTQAVVRPPTVPGLSFKFTVNATNVLSAATTADVAKVHTVPDPYYVTSAYEISIDAKDIQFVNVPIGATIRIYSSSGVLLRVLQNNSTILSGIVHWDVRNRTNQFVASGVYFYNVEANGVSYTGRMTIINYASTVQ